MSLTRRTLLATGTAIGAAASVGARFQDAELRTMETPSLAGKRILITGTSSGFGRAMAEHFARKGARVYATMRNTPRPEGAELKALAEADGLDLHVLRLDVREPAEIADAVAAVEADGGLDVLVNNAGIGITGPIEVHDETAMRDAFDTNVFGYQRVTNAFLPMMRAAGSGALFFISSQLGRVIVPASGLYSPCKFAVEAMAEQYGYELHTHGITSTIIQPGGYPTEIWVNRNRYTNALKDRAEPIHKAGYPDIVDAMGNEDGSGRSAEVLDVARAIGAVVAMPASERPLRVPVHPGGKPQTEINLVSARTQVGWIGQSPRWGDAVQAVQKNDLG